ncbi:hypothetical protein B7494_g4653 [Chlorociboria aeruginascens]|nr:hypothetical protein B7494_g4653 [Chlorociboria aeruginascens]
MGSSKTVPHQPGIYRDEPDRDDAASTSSAVLLDEIDYPDEGLPSYEDTASLLPAIASIPSPNPNPASNGRATEIRSTFPNYSTEANTLYHAIIEQAQCPPSYYVELSGHHQETVRQGNKNSKNTVTDFFIRLNMTHLLAKGPRTGGRLAILPGNKIGYRGGIIKRLTPTVSSLADDDLESQPDELKAWCDRYVYDPSSVKSFTLTREVANHDQKKVEQLLRSLVASTNYRGRTSVKFSVAHRKFIVYSPSKVNEWRITVWIRWVFYLTLLWIFAWPALFFMTARYEVVKVVYPYADRAPQDPGERMFTVMSEQAFIGTWSAAIKRGVLGRFKSNDNTCMDDEYRLETARAEARGEASSRRPIPTTGNSFADGALNVLGRGLDLAADFRDARGWGGDC